MSQSGIRILNITEKDESAIIPRDQGVSQTLPTDTSSSPMITSKMIEPTMVGQEPVTKKVVDPEGPVKTLVERCCWFIPVIKKSMKGAKSEEKARLVGKKHD